MIPAASYFAGAFCEELGRFLKLRHERHVNDRAVRRREKGESPIPVGLLELLLAGAGAEG